METLSEKLKHLRESKGLSLRKLGEILNIHFSTLGSYEQGRRNPDLKTLKQLAEFYGVTTDYLLGLVNDPNSKLKGEVALPNLSRFKKIPILGRVCAGNGMNIYEEKIGEIIDPFGNADFALEVSGNSMWPKFKNGDKVFVKKQSVAKNGSYVVAFINGDDGIIRKFKRFRESVYLIPENPEYETLEIRIDKNREAWGIIGIVVGRYEHID